MKTTHDHQEIVSWARRIQGKPQLIEDPERVRATIGVRIDFPGNDDDRFVPIRQVRDVTWQEFFKRFEKQQLEFLLSEDTPFTYRILKRKETET